MIDQYKWACAVLVGVVLGMACEDTLEKDGPLHSGMIHTAQAATPTGCANWEVEISERNIGAMPAGWEPFAYQSDFNNVLLRRCIDE